MSSIDKDKKQQDWLDGWILAGGSLVVLALGVLLFLWNKLPPEVPWLYSLPWGEQQLVSKVWFGAGLGGVMIILGLCGWFSRTLSKEDARAGVLLSRGGFMLTVIYLLSFFQVLRLMI